MCKKNLRLELAHQEDLERVLELYNDLIDSYRGGINYPDWTRDVYPNREYLSDCIEQGELYVGIIDDTIVGALVLNTKAIEDYDTIPWSLSLDENQVYFIHSFLVAKAFQGRGIGKKMMEAVIDKGRSEDKKAIRLDTIFKNTPAITFYERQNFTNLGMYTLNYEDTDITDFYLFEYNL